MGGQGGHAGVADLDVAASSARNGRAKWQASARCRVALAQPGDADLARPAGDRASSAENRPAATSLRGSTIVAAITRPRRAPSGGPRRAPHPVARTCSSFSCSGLGKSIDRLEQERCRPCACCSAARSAVASAVAPLTCPNNSDSSAPGETGALRAAETRRSGPHEVDGRARRASSHSPLADDQDRIESLAALVDASGADAAIPGLVPPSQRQKACARRRATLRPRDAGSCTRCKLRRGFRDMRRARLVDEAGPTAQEPGQSLVPGLGSTAARRPSTTALRVRDPARRPTGNPSAGLAGAIAHEGFSPLGPERAPRFFALGHCCRGKSRAAAIWPASHALRIRRAARPFGCPGAASYRYRSDVLDRGPATLALCSADLLRVSLRCFVHLVRRARFAADSSRELCAAVAQSAAHDVLRDWRAALAST